MNTAIFGFAVAAYILACYWGVRLYFSSVVKAYNVKNQLMRNVAVYVLFFLFVAIELPIAIFLPAWLGEELRVFGRDPATTTILILFGGCVLVGAVWKGWYSQDGRMFAKVTSQR